MDTLREKASRLQGRAGGVVEQAAPVLKTAPLLDVSGPVEYFLQKTPPEETFSVSDLPLSGGLEWLASEGKAAFLEARVGSGGGMQWASLLTEAVDSAAMVQAIRDVAEGRGVDVEYEYGDPGLVVMDPGIVDRAGALVYLEDRAGLESNRLFYETLFGQLIEIEELWGVLQVACFAGLCEDGGSKEQSGLIEPGAIWHLPLGEDGRVLDVAGDSDELMLFAPGVGDLEDLEDVKDFLAGSQRQFILALLFCVGCMGVARYEGAGKVMLTDGSEDSLGDVRVVDSSGLGSVLESKGGAGDLGLAHALTVCREQFGETGEQM